MNEDRCQPHGTNVVGPDYTAMCPFDVWVEMTDAIQGDDVEFSISFHWVSRAMARQQPGMSNPFLLQSEPKFHSLHLLDADKVRVSTTQLRARGRAVYMYSPTHTHHARSPTRD